MQITDLKALINDTLNTVGQETGALETFNWIDTGKTIASLSPADFKTYLNKFALGVIKNVYDTRVWKKTLDLSVDYQTYEGIKQYVKASPMEASDVTMVALVDGQDYNDRVYKDLNTSTLLTTKDFGFQVDWCVPQTELSFLFSSETSAMGYVAQIESAVANTFNRNKWNVQLSTLTKLVLDAVTGNRVVNLVTEYNLTHTPQVTTNTCLESVDFKRWACEIVANLREYMTDISKKYNDGSILSFVPSEDIRCTLLTQFSNALKNVSNYESVPALSWGDYNTVNAWQSTGSALLPDLATCGAITDSVTSDTATNVVGVLYDVYAVSMTIKSEKVTSDYVPAGDFTKFFGSFIGQSFVNNMNNAVVLTLN